MKAKLLFATLAELPKKIIEFNKTIKIIVNGEDNDYPDRIERLIQNSITAKQCKKLFRQFLTGNGFLGDLNDKFVNKKEEITVFSFLNAFNDEYASQGGVAVHVMHNIGGKPVSYSVIPFEHVRKGKKDDHGFNGKYGIHNNWPKAKPKEIKWLYSFNTDPEVVKANIKDAGGIKKYPGQLFFFNPSRSDYPLAHLHPVLNDADSEFRSSVFKNKSLRKGFFGKKILVTPPKIDPVLSSQHESNLSDEDRKDLYHQKELKKNSDEVLQSFVGVENNEGFLSLEMEFEGDDIEKAIKVIDIKTDIDDKLFEYTEKSSANNIRKAYNSVPIILIDSTDHSVFGNSGEALREARKFYQEQIEEEQKLIEQAMRKLFTNFTLGENLTIDPIVKIDKQDNTGDGNNPV